MVLAALLFFLPGPPSGSQGPLLVPKRPHEATRRRAKPGEVDVGKTVALSERSRDLFATPKPRSWLSREGMRSHFKSEEKTSSGRGNEGRREDDVRLGDVVDWRVEVS